MSRYHYFDGCKIEYPNAVAYAGMPAIVKITEALEFDTVTITMTVNGKEYQERRVLHNGEAIFDISRYMQLAFVGKNLYPEYGDSTDGQVNRSELLQETTATISLIDANGNNTTVLTFDCNAIYGYMLFEQSNGGVRCRKVFAEYPQTFDFLITPNTDIDIAYDNGDKQMINYTNDVKDVAQFSVELSRWWDMPRTAKTAVLSATNTIVLYGNEQDERYSEYRLTIDRSKSGVFLRWLDHFGQWCYYLLRPTGSNYTTKEVKSWLNIFVLLC